MPTIILVVGEYKTGKSVSAATFPKPMLFLDYDDGFLSVKNTKGRDGKLVVPNWNEIEVVKMFKKGFQSLEMKTSQKEGAPPPLYTNGAPELIQQFNDIMSSIAEGKKKYKTVVIDSLTSVFRNWKEAILKLNHIPALRISDYGTLEGILLGQFFPSLKALPVDFVILIDHVDMDKDEITGAIIEYPVGPSRNMGRNLGKEVDEIYRQKVEGEKYIWKTRKTGFFQAGSRLGLPDTLEANFVELEKHLTNLNPKV